MSVYLQSRIPPVAPPLTLRCRKWTGRLARSKGVNKFSRYFFLGNQRKRLFLLLFEAPTGAQDSTDMRQDTANYKQVFKDSIISFRNQSACQWSEWFVGKHPNCLWTSQVQTPVYNISWQNFQCESAIKLRAFIKGTMLVGAFSECYILRNFVDFLRRGVRRQTSPPPDLTWPDLRRMGSNLVL